MSDIALVNKDIVASAFGDILIANDDDDIIQMAINNITTIFGSNQFHPNIGNMVYHGRHKLSKNGLNEIATQCRNAMLSDHRIASVVEVIARNVSTISDYGLCEISFILVTTDGIRLSSNTTITVT